MSDPKCPKLGVLCNHHICGTNRCAEIMYIRREIDEDMLNDVRKEREALGDVTEQTKLKRAESIAKIWQRVKPVMLRNASRKMLSDGIDYELLMGELFLLLCYTAPKSNRLSSYTLHVWDRSGKVANLSFVGENAPIITNFKRGAWENYICSFIPVRKEHSFPIPIAKYLSDIRAGKD